MGKSNIAGCIDKSHKSLVATGTFGTGLLHFKDVAIPDHPDHWSTGIWIDVYSQCATECGNRGFWWKFEKDLSKSQAYDFAQSHNSPTTADHYVDGTPVVLKFMGETNCNPFQNYGC